MRLAVFGGTGPTGLILIKKALEHGYHVVVYTRNPSRLDIVHERLNVIQGELDDSQAISSTVQGCDAVISVLGPKGRTSGLPIPTGMANIVAAMKDHGVRRLVATATPSYHDPRDKFDVAFFLAVLLIRMLLNSAYKNIVSSADIVVSSDLDWTLVRIPLLSNAPDSGPPHVGYVGEPGTKLSQLPRETLAEFLLSQVADSSLVHEAPVVCAMRGA